MKKLDEKGWVGVDGLRERKGRKWECVLHKNVYLNFVFISSAEDQTIYMIRFWWRA